MARYYDTTFRESGTGRTKMLRGQGNTRTSAARAARRKLHDAVGDTSKWYETETTFVPEITALEERRTAERKRNSASFNHSARTTKHFEPLRGYCVCDHCAQLPAHTSQASETP